MGGGTPATQNTSTAPADPMVTQTVDQLLGKVQSINNQGSSFYPNSTYVPSGSTTQQGWQSALTNANNPGYTAGINKGINFNSSLLGNNGLTADQSSLYGQMGDLGHAYDSNSDAVSRLRSNLVDDTSKQVNSIFNASGRFGGGSNVTALGEGIGNALAGFDSNIYDKSVAARQGALTGQANLAQTGVGNAFNAGNNLESLFRSLLLPSQTIGAVGSAQDQNANATQQGNADLWQRQYDAPINRLLQLSSALGTNSNTAGTNTNSTQTPAQAPWYQQIGGGLLGLGSLLL